MGCNQIHHLFTKEFIVHEFSMDMLSTLQDEVLTSLRTLKNKWFFFLEKIGAFGDAERPFRVHTLETMSKMNPSKVPFAQNAQFLIAKTVEIIKANVTTFEKDGMTFYTPSIGERKSMTDKAGPRQALLRENTYFIVKAPSLIDFLCTAFEKNASTVMSEFHCPITLQCVHKAGKFTLSKLPNTTFKPNRITNVAILREVYDSPEFMTLIIRILTEAFQKFARIDRSIETKFDVRLDYRGLQSSRSAPIWHKDGDTEIISLIYDSQNHERIAPTEICADDTGECIVPQITTPCEEILVIDNHRNKHRSPLNPEYKNVLIRISFDRSTAAEAGPTQAAASQANQKKT
jgi:hypothetical protein